ncbi:MAG TPA: hypothetical protein VG476_14210 [Acidimicrobiales bacterium]|nr:hypothetical protein [Acidimicrobiales bacterium]
MAEALATADGGCEHCALMLAGEMDGRFPEHDWHGLVAQNVARNLGFEEEADG